MVSVAPAIDADTLRIRHEFLAVPTLRTSPDACAHLLNVSSRHAAHILESLVEEGFLRRGSDGEYAAQPALQNSGSVSRSGTPPDAAR